MGVFWFREIELEFEVYLLCCVGVVYGVGGRFFGRWVLFTVFFIVYTFGYGGFFRFIYFGVLFRLGVFRFRFGVIRGYLGVGVLFFTLRE